MHDHDDDDRKQTIRRITPIKTIRLPGVVCPSDDNEDNKRTLMRMPTAQSSDETIPQPTYRSGARGPLDTMSTMENEDNKTTMIHSGAIAVETPLRCKLDQYVLHCITSLSPELRRAYATYSSWAGVGPMLKVDVPVILGVGEAVEVNAARQAIQRAQSMIPPLADIDAAAMKYAAALDQLEQTLLPAIEYYASKRYKEDAFEVGRKLHIPLLQGFGLFLKADDALGPAVSLERKHLQERHLTRLEDSGNQNADYHLLKLVRAAEEVLAEAEPVLSRIVEREFKKAIDAFANQLAAARRYEPQTATADHNDYDDADDTDDADAAERDDEPELDLQSAEEFIECATARWNMVREGSEFPEFLVSWLKSGKGHLVEGSFPQLHVRFNDLLRTYVQQTEQ